MPDDAPRDDVAATRANLDRLRKTASKPPPSLQELAKLRAEVQAKRVEDDVRIVELDGPMKLAAWLCKTHRENLKPGWFVASTKDAPHPLVCDKCRRKENP
jgi:hypothetical protein